MSLDSFYAHLNQMISQGRFEHVGRASIRPEGATARCVWLRIDQWSSALGDRPRLRTRWLQDHPHLQPILQRRSIRRLLVLCQKFLRGGSGRLDVSPVFAAAKVVLLQFRTVVVYGFVKIIAPAQDAMFMQDKPDHKRDIAVSEGVRPGSPQSVRVDSAMSIAPALSALCMSPSLHE